MKKTIFRLAVILWFLSSLLLLPSSAAAKTSMGFVISATGAVTPAMEQYIARGIAVAKQANASLIILQLNTPGGQIEIMNRIVTLIRSSDIPVVVYVAPRGSMAASAGTVITLAGHLAAMAPETIIGAASPVGAQGEDIGTTMEAKAKEALMATVRSITTNRTPEAIKLAQETISKARAVSAQEALDIGLVDIIADSIPDLLKQLDGRTITLASGQVTLSTADLPVENIPQTFIEQLLATLINPNIVFLLLTIGVQAILIELSSPGGWVAGFIGAVCLALATYGLGILPVNWFGIVFLLLSFILFMLDIKAPTHGALTVAGIGSFIVGGLVLFNSPGIPDFQKVSVPLVIGSAVVTGAIFFVIVGFALRARKRPIISGQESLVEKIGTVREVLDPNGSVQLGGELWSAESESEVVLPVGTKVKVVTVKGLKLIVREVSLTNDK